MNFIKGILVGSMFCAGAAIMYKEGVFSKKTIKNGKKLLRKFSI